MPNGPGWIQLIIDKAAAPFPRGVWIRALGVVNSDMPASVEFAAGNDGSDFYAQLTVGQTLDERTLRQVLRCLILDAPSPWAAPEQSVPREVMERTVADRFVESRKAERAFEAHSSGDKPVCARCAFGEDGDLCETGRRMYDELTRTARTFREAGDALEAYALANPKT